MRLAISLCLATPSQEQGQCYAECCCLESNALPIHYAISHVSFNHHPGPRMAIPSPLFRPARTAKRQHSPMQRSYGTLIPVRDPRGGGRPAFKIGDGCISFRSTKLGHRLGCGFIGRRNLHRFFLLLLSCLNAQQPFSDDILLAEVQQA
jgi:hypothetical protein